MNAPTGAGGKVTGHTHIWMSALRDMPCNLTGREWPQADGTTRVEITDEDGSITAVLQTELVTVAEWRAAQSKAAQKTPLSIADATDPVRIEAYRLKLRASGFAPIPCAGKRPLQNGWQRLGDATEHEIKRWTHARSGEPNTGILTRLNPAVDIDILDEEAAKAAEALVRERFGEDVVFPVRFGKPPKRAILLRTDLPFKKLSDELVGPLGPEKGEKIEILCDGEQVICDGVHPDTQALYSWHGGRPGEDFKRADLALIDGHQAKRLLDDLVEMLIRDFGYIRKPPKTKPAPPTNGQDRSGQRGDWAIDFSDHDACTALAMRLLKSGMSDGTAVNFLRDNIQKLTNIEEDRRERRLREIPGMVSTARFKLDGKKSAPESDATARTKAVTVNDLRGYMPTATFIFMPSGELWPSKSVNARVPPVVVGVNAKGEPITVPAATWLMRNQPCEQMVWAPGEPQLIGDRLVTLGGWIDHPGANVFNLYRPPTLKLGDPAKAGKWVDHIKLIYPLDADHIIKWLAHRVQKPHIKINHALVLGGPQGVGKDTLLEPVKRAVGAWNFQEVSPQQTLGRFNGFLKSVILRVSEVRDMGEVNRFAFYEHMKAYTASPPDTLRVDEKNLREHYIMNVCGVVMTTNNKTNGIYLPADDRRTFVAWTEMKKEDFDLNYWIDLWSWYDQGGDCHVAAYLATLDLSDFDPKAPPPKTPAFWDIVDSGRVSEDAELADILDVLGGGLKDAKGNLRPPLAFAMSSVLETATFLSGKDLDGYPRRGSFAAWLTDRKNRPRIPHRFESCGYSPVRNAAVDDGLWKVGGKRQVIYARADLPVNDRARAAEVVVRSGAPVLSLPVRK